MSTDTPRLAFRVFGNFHWPPVRDDLDKSTDDPGNPGDLQKGVVEIYFAPQSGSPAGDLHACLRWRAKGDHEAPVPEPFTGSFEDKNVHDINALTSADLKKLFQDSRYPNKPVLLRLVGKVPSGPRLLFRGAFLFDQFKLYSDSGIQDPPQEPPLDLRWVLARSFKQYGGPPGHRVFSNFFSEVVIGQQHDDQHSGSSIRFNLALPTPGAQSGDAQDRCYALPFAAIILAVQHTPAAPSAVPVNGFIAGPGPAIALRDMPPAGTPLPNPSEIFTDRKQLGQFGFCAGDGRQEFLFFPRYRTENFPIFWPTSSQAFIEDFLGMLSQAVSGPDLDELLAFEKTAKTNKGELAHSLRFDTDFGGARTVMTFRTRVTIADPTPWRQRLNQFTNDLRVEGQRVLIPQVPPSFQVRLPNGAWLHTRTDTMHVEREIAYTISPDAIWSLLDDPSKVGGEITVRLGFAEKGLYPQAAAPTEFLRDLLTRPNPEMRFERWSLRDVADGQPQSILPWVDIDWPGLSNVQWQPPDPILEAGTPRFMFCGSIPFAFQSTRTAVNPTAQSAIAWKKKYPRRELWAGLDINLTLWPRADTIDSEASAGVVPGRLSVELLPRTFLYLPQDPLELSLIADPEVPSADGSRWCQFRIDVRLPVSKAPPMGRLGGFEFTVDDSGIFKEQDDNPADYSYWRFGDRKAGASDFPLANVDVRLRLAISNIMPIATDRPWGDRTAGRSPLLIPSDGNTGKGQFVLDMRETVAAAEDRQLTASIYSMAAGAAGSSTYVVLSEEPFTITRLRAQPLQGSGTQENALVATFDSDTRQWQVKVAADTYHYEYPPQVAGESMDKPRRLEIQDAAGEPQPPYNRPIDDQGRPYAVEFRLTPSAEIWIKPSDVELGYFLPEWASHEIFRQRGALGVGAALMALRAEFLYGLSVGVDPTSETGAARSARVAEIEALTGSIPGKPATANTGAALYQRWVALDRALIRRPERIEIWARDPTSSVPLSPAKFSDGVTFALRRTALHRPAIDDGDENSTAKVRLSRYGLSGGALWPLESRNFFHSLVQNPGSTGGTIDQIALSPLGGDANQKAEFLNKKVRIITETRNGFVQRHKIEIIGRISVFWHWAKYVVVYERTVNPSAQFTPDGGIGQRTRRPVLRKVSEYIYIRQPQGIRRFPDFPTAESSSTGPLNAVKFNSITINVDSAWSEDVGKYGWIIPLWNRAAALRRPQVYPRPDIAFSTVAEGQGEEAVTSQECIEPDNIYFYADASPDTSEDTDTWPSQFGIDCSRLTPPTDEFQRPLGAKNTDGMKSQPGAARIPRGHRRFTWRLAPPAKKTALNAGRSSKPIYAGLESITFMRSNAQAPELIGSPPVRSSALPDAVKSANHVTRPAADPLPIWHKGDYPGHRQSPPGAFDDLSDALKAFLEAAKAADKTAIQKALNGLKAVKSTLQNDPTLKKYADAAKANATALRSLKEFATNAPQQCQQLADDFVGSIKRKELLVLDAITTWENYIDALPLVSSPPIPITRDFLVQQLADSLKGQIAAVTSGASADIGQVEAGIEKARDVLHDFQNQLAETGDDLRLKLAAFKAAYDDGKPWSDARITELQTKLEAERARAFHAVETLVEEARVRLTSELDGFAQGVANVLQHGIEEIVSGGSELQQRLTGSWKLVSVYLQRVEDFLDGQQGLESKLADLQAEVNASPLGTRYDRDFDRIAGLLRTAEQDLQSAQRALTDQERTASAAIGATLAESVNQLQSCVDAIASVTAATTALLNALAQSIDAAAINRIRRVIGPLTDLEKQSLAILRDFGAAFDAIVDEVANAAVETLDDVSAAIAPLFQQLDDEGQRLASQVDRLRRSIGPDAATAYIADNVLTPAINSALSGVTDADLSSYTHEVHDRLRGLIADTSTFAKGFLENLSDQALGDAKKQVVSMCNLVGAGLQQGFAFLEDMENAVQDRLDAITGELQDLFDKGDEGLKQIEAFADGFAADVRQINNDIATSYASAKGYGNRVLEAAGNLGTGGIGAVPGNILRLYAAVASAPALPNLDFARDRLGYYYNQLNQVIDTTPAEAWFGHLGDELKALGLSIPFSQMGDRILPDDLSNFDISRIFKNFSGMKLDKLFDGYKLPPEATDAIKVTHAFDKAQARAWVEIDVDLPMPDRKAMFSIGPFELDYVNSHFVAMVRLEASKDTDKVDEIGRAALTTDFEAVVSGETMVSFQQVVLRYDKASGGLKVDFDPKRIRLNAIFQFIQDTLGSIFPDEIGGLTVIKDNGIPVGIEHVFAMPPIDLDFATSGVTNITISNTFGLVAYPEFMIFDRFALSRPELPFIFSIFVIGGTGYITVQTEYHPFQENGLMVSVEAAAGGSAQVGFAFGVVSGSVFITISVALKYTKVFGTSGGGLTISLVLVVAGNVDIAGIVTVYIGLMLRMSYQDSGAIDASGTLTVTIQITRFFTLSATADVQYRLRGGKSETTSSVKGSANVDTTALNDAATKLVEGQDNDE
ncbi:coiled-coil domain-containing protein [Bradyrhizobium diazoefficiens]|uniref:hypothetical protein n=1 Tax=Bradyrhizobium diazoefficiens TaxID=1355477 RepID=UPI00347049F2